MLALSSYWNSYIYLTQNRLQRGRHSRDKQGIAWGIGRDGRNPGEKNQFREDGDNARPPMKRQLRQACRDKEIYSSSGNPKTAPSDRCGKVTGCVGKGTQSVWSWCPCSPVTRRGDGRALGMRTLSSEGMSTSSSQRVYDSRRLVTHLKGKLSKQDFKITAG